MLGLKKSFIFKLKVINKLCFLVKFFFKNTCKIKNIPYICTRNNDPNSGN